MICRVRLMGDKTGQTVSDEQMQALNLKRDKFHGEWNYLLTPRQ